MGITDEVDLAMRASSWTTVLSRSRYPNKSIIWEIIAPQLLLECR
jgi:hypothetical protein